MTSFKNVPSDITVQLSNAAESHSPEILTRIGFYKLIFSVFTSFSFPLLKVWRILLQAGQRKRPTLQLGWPTKM